MVKKKFNQRYLRIKSRHPSHHCLRRRYGNGILLPTLALIRFGSTTESNVPIQINSIEGTKNSASKFRMKKCFKEAQIKSAKFWMDPNEIPEKSFPIVAKLNYGSRGSGMKKLDSKEDLNNFLKRRNRENYYYEKFYSFTREYRLHVTEDGCFYACRKLLKSNTDTKDRWYRNNDNCVWYVEDNPKFNKPESWDLIVEECVKALKSLQLDFAACDVKVNKEGEFVVLELNSAPSFGEKTEQEYRKIIPKLYNKKLKELNS